MSSNQAKTRVGYFDTKHGQRVFIYGDKAFFVSLSLITGDDEGRKLVDEKLREKLELGDGEYEVGEVWPPDWASRD